MFQSRSIQAALIVAMFAMLAASAATGFPNGYFDKPWPRGLRMLDSIVANLGTGPFGHAGGAILFTLLGVFCAWAVFNAKADKKRPTTRSERTTPFSDTVDEDVATPQSGFGRKRAIGVASQPATAQKLIPALDRNSVEHIEWLKMRNNAADNFEVVSAELCFGTDPHRFIDWLIEQPDLDRGTAAFIFFGSGGLERTMGVPYYGRLSSGWADRLLEAVSTRSKEQGFQFDRIAPPSWCHDSREKLLQFLSEPSRPVNFEVPFDIFQSPFIIEGMASNYSDIGEGELVTDSWLSETLPHIYGPDGTMPEN